MAVQGEQGQGGLGMCFDVGSMARDSYFYNPTANCSQWGRSPSYTEHELCRQTNSKSRNSGTIAPQRNTELAAINSTTNGITRGGVSQPPIQTTWARQANIGKLQAQLEEEKRKHDLELKQLKEEVRSGNQIRESLEQKIKRGEKSLDKGRKNCWESQDGSKNYRKK